MTLTSLQWARSTLRQATASTQAGPSSLAYRATFSTTARRCAGTDDVLSAMDEAMPSSSTRDEPAPSTFRSNIIPGFRSSSSPPHVQRMAASRAARRPFNLHIQSTRNNTILCLTDPEGAPITRVSTGMLGFKHSARSGYEAGHQTAIRMFSIIQENKTKWRIADLNLVYKGFGLGRDAVHRALLTDEGTQVRNLVREVKDATALKVGGTRPKKQRML